MKFEPGKTYATTSACNSDCIFTVKIISRTEKTVTYKQDGERVRRSKIHKDNDGEYIRPDNYSMSPIFRACREIA